MTGEDVVNEKEFYKNGQRISELKGDILTYFFDTGDIKAKGKYIDGNMEGEWIFYKKSGYLWQRGNFVANKKHGDWIRYDKDGDIDYHAQFTDGKLAKKIPLT